MNYFKNAWNLVDNYLLARWQKRPSTAYFWYLPEPPNVTTYDELDQYKSSASSPRYLIDYRPKLEYSLSNADNIIVLPYSQPTGLQINPEAAFQYALGLHEQFYLSRDNTYRDKFMYYANYFLTRQTKEGFWEYNFDWYGSKAPWHSALAQARGSSVMLRAWKQSGDEIYLDAAKLALSRFMQPTSEGGFLHYFQPVNCPYFEEYPHTPTGVINGFMACLMNIWELMFWTDDPSAGELWVLGIDSLEKMLPFYSTGWWSLYDLDNKSPIANVNSPRYHLMEINYLKILSTLSGSTVITNEYIRRAKQYDSLLSRLRAFTLKFIRKVVYK